MFAIIFVAASLLTQAYLFRNVSEWEVNRDVTLDSAAADVWTAESDSSRTGGSSEGR